MHVHVCTYVCTPCAFLVPGEVRIRGHLRFPRNRSYRLFEVTMWAIGTELRSLARAVDGLNCCAISPAHLFIYIYIYFACVCHSVHVEVSGEFAGVCFCPWDWTQVVGFGSRCLIPSHLLDLRNTSDGFSMGLTQNPGSKSELLFLASTVTFTQDLLLLLLAEDGDVLLPHLLQRELKTQH